MDTQGQAGSSISTWAKGCDWQAALGSDDPAQQWAASCSIAAVATARDLWVDSTLVYEASVGAFEAATEECVKDRVNAAFAGARRAAYWEREARARLVPPVSYREHRWMADVRAGGQVALAPQTELIAQAAEPRTVSTSRLAPRLGGLLEEAGWRWCARPAHVAADAIEEVCRSGRDRAGRRIIDRYPSLPTLVASGMVLLVAGSRRRDGLGWPGVVWLDAHRGWQRAADDPGTRSVLSAVAEGRRARPVNVVADSIATRQPGRRNVSTTAARRRSDALQAVAS
ncbi:MAG: hypothetical protein BGO26_01045 [Actinobacteria bacterium 69-20]|nr:hypothetical protein [Actinomycetota bacterium]OJV28591.1 MAG: hypothetical protein BGO26_01045 [Actinobacteria bacterium 69-20]